MEFLKLRNQKMINAVIEKAEKLCPGSLALIGVNGSFMRGDFYEKSDLDLLILMNDNNGWQLGCCFIQDDFSVGHDIYCTTWEQLQDSALYNDPNISKLLDAKIVYCADEKYVSRLEELRKKVRDNLCLPFSKEDYFKAEKYLKEAEHFYMQAMIAEEMSEVRINAGYAVSNIENGIAMLNKTYFRYGVKDAYKELEAMERKPQDISSMIEAVVSANSAEAVKRSLTSLIQEAALTFKKAKKEIPVQKKPATPEALAGTVEEMYSNWRNKMYLAAETGNRHLAFMSILSMNHMLSEEIKSEYNIGDYDVMNCCDPNNLKATAEAFDGILKRYSEEYKKVGIQVKRYADIDEFVRDYQERK